MVKKHLLPNLRTKINILDEKLLLLLAERRRLSVEIAMIKLMNCSPLRDISREIYLLQKLVQLGKLYYLDEYYIVRLFKIIIEDSLMIQLTTLEKYFNICVIK